MATTTLSVTKTTSSTTVIPGGSITYTITLRNTGHTAAATPSLTDNAPTGTVITDFKQTSGTTMFTITSNSFTANAKASTMMAGESAIFTLTLMVPLTATCISSITNVATAVADNAPTASGTASTVVVLNPLTITKTATPTIVQAGSEIVFTITVTNSIAAALPGVIVTDTLPSGLIFLSGSSSTGVIPTVSSNVVTFSPKLLQPGANTFTIIVLVTSATQPGILTDTATVIDPITCTTKTAIATITVISSSTVTVTKIGPTCVKIGNKIIYTIVVTNTGPSDVANLTLEESIFCNKENKLKLCETKLVQLSGPTFSPLSSVSVSPLKFFIASFTVGSVAIFQFIVCAPSREGCVINSARISARSSLSSNSITSAQVLTKLVKNKSIKVVQH